MGKKNIGWGENIEDLHLVRDLSETEKPIKEQSVEFNKITGKSRATFFRVRQNLNLHSYHKFSKYKQINNHLCYFCLRKAEATHHLDWNNKNNQEENLLPLCKSCHIKLHKIMTSLGLKSAQSRIDSGKCANEGR